MQPYKRLIAIVKFDNWSSANAAFMSPKVVFDNRFVKVFWYTGDQSTIPASMTVSAGAGATNGHLKMVAARLHQERRTFSDPTCQATYMDEFSQRSTKSQKKAKRRNWSAKGRSPVAPKELLLKRQEEVARLNAKLALSSRKEREANAADASEVADGVGEAKVKPGNRPKLKSCLAQLAALGERSH